MAHRPFASTFPLRAVLVCTVLLSACSHKHVHHKHPNYLQNAAQQPSVAKSFNSSDVVLSSGSRFAEQQRRNIEFLLQLNFTNAACQYLASANLSGTYENPTCIFEDQSHYFGHYVGHYLSALALAYENTGDSRLLDVSTSSLDTLARVQAAWTAAGEPGYLFAYNTTPWQQLLENATDCSPVCVPFYISHKLLAGLLDQYTRIGLTRALDIALGMANWIGVAINRTLARGGQEQWQKVLSIEWGGMNDALYQLYTVTGNSSWLTTAGLFTHWNWTDPLVMGVDALGGNHANTHIPEVIGDARGWELTGNSTKSTIVSNFFSFLNGSHSFATGGSNDHQFWGSPNQMGDQLDAVTEESCTQYNVLKLARHVFTWTGGADTRWTDFYERALFNGLVGNQASTGVFSEPNVTGFTKYLSLGGAKLMKDWGPSDNKLTCCWGTLSETFSKLSDSIFFSSTDDSTLFINLFVPASVTWRGLRGGVVVIQVTGYPYEANHTTTVIVNATGSGGSWTVSIRVPFWATGANTVTLNGQALVQPVLAGHYLNITRTWAAGDAVTAWFPPSLRWEALNDARPAWAGVGAVMYGGLLLAGVNTTQGGDMNSDSLAINPAEPLQGQIVPDPMASAGTLRFLAPLLVNGTTPCRPTRDHGGHTHTHTHTGVVGSTAACTDGQMAALIPIMDVVFETYSVYWHTQS